MSAPRRRARRSDALSNRAELLAAAGRALRRHGPRVTLETIAREAGVGIATLYRNFASREELMEALSHRAYEHIAALIAEALAKDVPALEAIAWLFAQRIADGAHCVTPLFGGAAPASGETRKIAARMSHDLGSLLQRGIDDGTIRPDAHPADLIVAVAVLADAQLPPAAWRRLGARLAGIVIDGLRAREPRTPLPDPLTSGAARP